jgi:hypothetical protein
MVNVNKLMPNFKENYEKTLKNYRKTQKIVKN